eukprot:281284-Amorphochlora_amoeboformis.AAC.1
MEMSGLPVQATIEISIKFFTSSSKTVNIPSQPPSAPVLPAPRLTVSPPVLTLPCGVRLVRIRLRA